MCFTFTSIVRRFNSIFSSEILFYLNFASFTFQIAATFFLRMPEYILVSRIPENTNSCGVIRLLFFILFELSIYHFYFDLGGYTNLYSKPHLYATDSKKMNKKPPNLSSAHRLTKALLSRTSRNTNFFIKLLAKKRLYNTLQNSSYILMSMPRIIRKPTKL